jgi:hypothetical protein
MVELMIDKAKMIDNPERKQQMVKMIANTMKAAYVAWNKDTVSDETIIKDLRELSHGELQLQDNVNLNRVDVRQVNPSNRQQRSSGGNKNRQNNNRNNSSANNRGRNNGGGGKRY